MKLAKALAFVSIVCSVVIVNHAAAHSNKWSDSHSGNDTAIDENLKARYKGLHAYRWKTNGCTVVADSQNGVFHFEHACDHHDGCYGGHWSRYGRLGCDNEFWRNMEASCKHNWAWWNPARTACRTVRDTYYIGVRNFGWPAYNARSIWARLAR